MLFKKSLVAVALGALLIASCGSGSSQTVAAAAAPVPPDGMAIYKQYCIACHGANGKLGLSGAKDLSLSVLTMEERVRLITNGKNMMTPFNEVLSTEEIEAVAQYTFKLKQQ